MKIKSYRGTPNGFVFVTDEGVFTTAELAKKLGIAKETLLQRVRIHGYDSPRVVEPKQAIGGGNYSKNEGKWGDLGDKPRKKPVFLD